MQSADLPGADPHAHTQAPSPKGDIEPIEAGPTEADSAGLPAEPGAPSQEELKLPRYGTRGSTPGHRGCWALNKAGEPCGAARRADSDYCNAHSGIGVAGDPKGHSKAAVRKSAEVRRRRADLRLVLGQTRLDTPRGALRALVLVEAERLAGRAVGAALDPSVDQLKAGQHALALIEAVDPKATALAVVTTKIDPSTASFSELVSFAEQHGIAVPGLDQPSIEG